MSEKKITIIFPSGPPSILKVNEAIVELSKQGFSTFCPLLEQPSRLECSPGYLCGSDSERAEELVLTLGDPDQKTIWCGRGGYGATRILAEVSKRLADKELPETLFLGYSDITALFALIKVLKLPVRCIHSPVAIELPKHLKPASVLSALKGKPQPLPLTSPSFPDFKGTIWGGNLAVLASLCGTPWLPEIEDQAIFLEDVDEQPYRLDRFLTQLYDNNFFKNSKGVFLGNFTRCGSENSGIKGVRKRLQELKVPLLGELPAGHETLHLPLFLDHPYSLDSNRCCLRPL